MVAGSSGFRERSQGVSRNRFSKGPARRTRTLASCVACRFFSVPRGVEPLTSGVREKGVCWMDNESGVERAGAAQTGVFRAGVKRLTGHLRWSIVWTVPVAHL